MIVSAWILQERYTSVANYVILKIAQSVQNWYIAVSQAHVQAIETS